MLIRTLIRCTVLLSILIATSKAEVEGPPRGETEALPRHSEFNKSAGKASEQGCFQSSPPIADSLGAKNRALGIIVGDPGRTQAIRLRFLDLPAPYNAWNGATMWVGDPRRAVEFATHFSLGAAYNASFLSCTPVFVDWTEILGSCSAPPRRCFSSANLGEECSIDDECVPAVVQVFHEGIIPDAEYELQVLDSSCDPDNEDHYSLPLTLKTSRWGDVVGDCSTKPCGESNGGVDIIDILATLFGFVGNIDAMIKARADLEPACPDLVINITDALRCVEAFQGLPYPFAPTTEDPCDSPCQNPLP